VVVVVPAYCEERLVAGVLETMPAFVDRVVVVDDGSPDATSARANAVGDARVEVVRHEARRGVGAASATGNARALTMTSHPADAVCVMAGDGQMDPADHERVAGPIVRGAADYVKGDRFGARDVRSQMGLGRWIGGQVFSRVTSLAVGGSIHDSQCGYTALARGTLERLPLDRMWPSFGYPNDLLGLLGARRARVAEVAVRPVYGTEQSKLRLRHLPGIAFVVGRALVRRRPWRPGIRTVTR
jgi:glycosyltransferase involved in cell wall biosynthesis